MRAWAVGVWCWVGLAGAGGCQLLDPGRAIDAALEDVLGDTPVAAALEAVLCGDPAPAPCAGRLTDAWSDTQAFYALRDGRPAWVDHHGPTPAAERALLALARARDHGLTPDDYGQATLTRTHAELIAARSPDRRAPARDLARFDSQLTAALLALGREVAFGRTLPDASPPRGASRRPQFALAPRLARLAEADALDQWPDDVRPAHPEYAALQAALALVNNAEDRRRLAINLNRWRWMPDDLGARHVIVNIPQYYMFVREQGRVVVESRAIVGKRGDETPVFSATMRTVVFSPYWNIPESIATGETLPAIRRDPGYLAKNDIEVLRRTASGVQRVDPATVNWRDRAATRDLILRQRPGAGNALGHIKFVFPNPYTVFMHDTPAHKLFDQEGRAFSHGCIRLQQPLALAKYLFAGDADWDEPRIRAAMLAGVEREVPLRSPLPVHVVYFTAWVDEQGVLRFFDDVYRYDR